MIQTIEKEKKEKKRRKIIIICIVIVYIYAVMVFFHTCSILRENKRISTSDAVNIAMSNVFSHPGYMFPIDTEKLSYVLMASVFGGCLVFMLIITKSLKKHDNPETVNGEAHLMTHNELQQYNLKFAAPLGKPEINGYNNMIISKDIRLAIDNKGTRRNCNILVIGGSGAGKSRFFASPNILQYNANFVITDPSGEMLKDYGKALEDNGYAVKVFNLTNVYRSNRYNPFHYICEEKDVFILVNTLIKNTTPEGKGSGEPFWENSEKLLITALILYIWHVFPKEKQSFDQLMYLLAMAEVDENDPNQTSPLDILFEDLRSNDPENLAVKQYEKFKIGAGKTLKSILISVNVRLQAFSLSDIIYLTSEDDFELEKFSDTKQALFVIIPTADTTFNFLVSLLYCQIFSSQYDYAEQNARYGWQATVNDKNGPFNIRVEHAQNVEDSENAKKRLEKFIEEIRKGTKIKYDKQKELYRVYTKSNELVGWRGTKEKVKKFVETLKNIKISPCSSKCPNHIRLILDEFANIGQIPDFDQKLATMRKYEISCSIILQALSQLKDIYKDKWNTIVANCDTKLFLGSDDSETIEWMLKMLGKKTTTVENTSYQANGNGSSSYNKSSIELLTIDQISMMQDNECLVRIRGVRPHYGKKYELTEHPNYAYAHEREDKFIIPLSDAVKQRDNRPLYVRQHSTIDEKQKQKTIKLVTEKEEKTTQQKTNKSKENKDKNIVKNNVEGKLRQALNKNKQDSAKQAKESITKNVKMTENVKAPEVSEVMEAAYMLGDDATDEIIKEAVETIIDLQFMNMENVTYHVS